MLCGKACDRHIVQIHHGKAGPPTVVEHIDDGLARPAQRHLHLIVQHAHDECIEVGDLLRVGKIVPLQHPERNVRVRQGVVGYSLAQPPPIRTLTLHQHAHAQLLV